MAETHTLSLKFHMEQNDHQIRYDRYVTQGSYAQDALCCASNSARNNGNCAKFVHVIYNLDHVAARIAQRGVCTA